MNVVSDKVEALVQLEYEADCNDHGPLASLHEGYAVLLEEMQETDDALGWIKWYLDNMWNEIKRNDAIGAVNCARLCKTWAEQCACEAIQVAAVCQRIMDLQTEETT